jgi:hypothetical protein
MVIDGLRALKILGPMSNKMFAALHSGPTATDRDRQFCMLDTRDISRSGFCY